MKALLKFLAVIALAFCATGCATRNSVTFLANNDGTISTFNEQSEIGPFNSSAQTSESRSIDPYVDGDELIDKMALQFVMGEESKTTISTGSGWLGEFGRLVAAFIIGDGHRSAKAVSAFAAGGTATSISNSGGGTINVPGP